MTHRTFLLGLERRTRPLALALLWAAALLGGCASARIARGIPPTEVRKVRAGDTREAVEKVLGAPLRSHETDQGTVFVYRCDRGLVPENFATGVKDDTVHDERFLAARNTVFSLLFLGLPEIYARQEIKNQQGEAEVAYDETRRVIKKRVECREPAPAGESLVEIF